MKFVTPDEVSRIKPSMSFEDAATRIQSAAAMVLMEVRPRIMDGLLDEDGLGDATLAALGQVGFRGVPSCVVDEIEYLATEKLIAE